jgi:hypothetical protein
MCGREDKKSVFTRTLNPVKEEKVFEVERIYCSDITGSGVRPFPDLVFEVERIIQSFPHFHSDGIHYSAPLFTEV